MLFKSISSLKSAFVDEAQFGILRLLYPLWLGCGIALYYALPIDVHVYYAYFLLIFVCFSAFFARKTAIFALFIAIAWGALGFSAAAYRQDAQSEIMHISAPMPKTFVEGYITQVDWYPETVRVQLLVYSLMNDGKSVENSKNIKTIVLNAYDALPQQKGLKAGLWLKARVSLRPSPPPILPQHPDPRFRDYFEGVSARGTIRVVESLALPSDEQITAFKPMRYWIYIQNLRVQIRDSILQLLSNENGAIAAALTMGDRSGISPEVTQNLTAAGLLHFLSISGAHMAMVAGVVFLIFRSFLSCIPLIARRFDLKKIAAMITFFVASFYLLLSGGDFATQRSYIMICVMLLAVMVSRPAFTLHSLCIAAVIILLLNPEALYYPGLQMSFAATAALLAVVRYLTLRPKSEMHTYSFMRSWMHKILHFVFLSLAAGIATEVFAAFYFHQFMPFSLIGNVLAAPLIEILIMPFLMLGLLLMPFGVGQYPFEIVNWALNQLKDICAYIASFSNAIITVPPFEQNILVCAVIALIIACVFKTHLRFMALIPVALGGFFYVSQPLPDIMGVQNLVSVAIKSDKNQYDVLQTSDYDFAVKAWKRAYGAGKIIDNEDIKRGVVEVKREGWPIVKIAQHSSAQCDANAIIITKSAPENCQSIGVIDDKIHALGSFSIWFMGQGHYRILDMRGTQNRAWVHKE